MLALPRFTLPLLRLRLRRPRPVSLATPRIVTRLIATCLIATCLATPGGARAGGFEIEVALPRPGERIQNEKPFALVEGIARPREASGRFDVMVVLDSSLSTVEPSGADIDLDGQTEDAWGTADSIYRAEHLAAGLFSRMMSELRPDASGQSRVRIGLVTFAGEVPEPGYITSNRRIRRAEIEDLDVADEMKRSALLELPLTSDFDEMKRTLVRTALYQKRKQLGTYTNFVGGISRALDEIERNRRPDAAAAILFLTDGEATLPFNKHVAGMLAVQVAQRAADANVRINAFGIGETANRAGAEKTLRRIAKATGGIHTSVKTPGEIIDRIRQRSISEIRSGNIIGWGGSCDGRSRTPALNNGARNVAFNLDGSFSGYVRLAEGPNCIEIVASTADGDLYRQRVPVDFRYPPGFVEASREQLLAEMVRVRQGQKPRERDLWFEMEDPDRESVVSPLPLLDEAAED